ncbi:hypothetical protein P879_03063 [Paragonimus westermani]|uniref:Androglobin n=1 Tax=Paragonimus westermani TaxID=34504 RepID=A0A8T0DJE3_9TREM|nr:hypothetical protein P879_03063 [Paragonimus westermani]
MKNMSDLKAAGSAMERTIQRGQYLFVDSVHPSEVIFHLSTISRWPVPSGKESHLSCSRGISFAPDVEELTIPPSSSEPLKRSSEVADRDSHPARSQTGELTNSSTPLPPPAPATLVIESVQWLSEHLGQPLKRIDVTGCRAISVCLPSGRHCLSIMVHSPLGFHLTVIGAPRLPRVEKSPTDRPVADDKLTDEKSSYPVVREARPISSAKGGQNTRTTCNMGSLLVHLGDEDCVLSNGLSQLPQRIRQHADQLVNSLYKLAIATASLSNPDSWPLPTEAPTSTWISSHEQEVDLFVSAAIAQDPEAEQNQRANLCVTEFYNRRKEVESLLRNNWTSDDYDRTGALGTRSFRQTLLNLLHHACGEGDGSLVTPEMNLAWRVMQLDLTTENPLCVTYGSIGNSTSAPVAPKPKSKPQSTRPEKQVHIANKPSNEESLESRWSQPVDPDILIAIVRIQAVYRGYRARQIRRLHDPWFIVSCNLMPDEGPRSQTETDLLLSNTPSHSGSSLMNRGRLLQAKRLGDGWLKCMTLLKQAHLNNEVGVELTKQLIREGSIQFEEDLANYLAYADYTGTYAEIAAPTLMADTTEGGPGRRLAKGWLSFLFRDILYVTPSNENDGSYGSSKRFALRFKTTLPGCRLLIIDNDNGKQLKSVYEAVTNWLTLRTNRHGYSLLGISGPGPAPAGSWLLRILAPAIDGGSSLPQFGHSSKRHLCVTFQETELADYYVPHKSGLLFQRQVVVNSDQLISVHLRLSAHNVPVLLRFRDRGEIVVQARGEGEACILAHLLRAPNIPESPITVSSVEGDDLKKSGPKEHSDGKLTLTKTTVRPGSQRQPTKSKKASINSRNSSASSNRSTTASVSPRRRTSVRDTTTGNTTSAPKSSQAEQRSKEDDSQQCWLEAYVDTRKWPLNLKNWLFLEELKRKQLDEYSLSNESRAVSTGRASDKVNPREKTVKPGSSPRQIKSKPPSQPESARLDYTQAHWRMRIIVDASAASEIVLSKPEDRAAEIRMIKKAWEEMEPGRAERAALSRARYLESQAAKMSASDSEPVPKDVSDDESSSPIVGLERDRSAVYTLEPPTDLSRTLAPIPSLDKTAYQRDCLQVEQERILTAMKTFNAHTDSWFIGTQCLQAYGQLTSDAQDWLSRFNKKQEIFKRLNAQWDAVQAADRRERLADHKRYTLLLRTVQLLNDKIRAGYHQSCESLRQQLVVEYRKQLELELAISGEDNKPAVPFDSRSQSKQKKKKDKSPGSRSGSGRRTK